MQILPYSIFSINLLQSHVNAPFTPINSNQNKTGFSRMFTGSGQEKRHFSTKIDLSLSFFDMYAARASSPRDYPS